MSDICPPYVRQTSHDEGRDIYPWLGLNAGPRDLDFELRVVGDPGFGIGKEWETHQGISAMLLQPQ